MPEIDQGDSQAATSQIHLAFSTIVSASAPPYGYTVSVWTSGAILMHFRSTPNVGDVFLNPRRSGDIRRLIDTGAVPRELKLPR